MSEQGGRVVVVTGGARGIGDAIIRSFVARGDRAVSIDLGDPDDAIEGVRYLSGNVGDRAAMEAAFADIGATEGRVDVLVNNAGIQRVGLTESFDPEVWRQVVDVHLFGMFNCCALALPSMKRQGSGAIVSISSTASIVGVPGRGPYSAAKGAISAWTRSLAVEVAEDGIRVNAVAPGSTLTKLVQQGLSDGSIERDWILSEIPMRRFGKVEEIANVVRFLASDEASYVTGQTIVVDGGWTIQGMRDRPDWLKTPKTTD
jgi:NAD(P)-dependent dehydrogenase (short-subunit alcohol dehydrogenase family)